MTPAPLRFALPSVSLIFALACGQSGREPDARAAAEAIRQQIAKYAAALNAADVAVASQVWDTTGDVSFISPAGHQRGWEDVKGVYAFFGSTFSERTLTTRDTSIHVLGDAAWAEFYWHFVAKQRTDGSTVQTDGRETQVYRKVGDRWALVHVHYSGPPNVPPAQ
jgi:ketosteroid isomerase-like protein